jgi:uncharacterized protein involved in exopolysaccharide biosynthesis
MTNPDAQSGSPSAAIRRRFWKAWILVPAILGALTGAVLAARAAPVYRSETLILVVPQRVPEWYVRPSITSKFGDRLQSISQQILSRTRLERIIQDFDLYKDERRRGEHLEDIVEMMRKNIDLTIEHSDAFRVGFRGTDPRTIMKVTDRLASLFIEESLRDRELLAQGTNQFLVAMLENVRERLVEKNRQLRAAKPLGAPAPEAEPLAIEYEVLQTTYKDLLAKIEESRVAANLESRQIGEQFKLVDPARLPEQPIAPNRRTYIGIGAGTGAAIGLLVLLVAPATSLRRRPEIPDEEVPHDGSPSEAPAASS